MIAPVAQQWEGPEPHGLGPSPIVCCPSAHPCCAGDARGSGSRAGAVSIGGVHAAPRPLPESVTDALHACSTRSAREALHPLRRATPVTSQCTRSEEVQCLQIGCTASHNKHNRGQFAPTDPNRPPRTQQHSFNMLARLRTRGATPVTSQCTRYVAMHPLRRDAPVTSQCTRYAALHPIRRGAMPTDRVHRLPQQAQPRPIRPHRPQPSTSDAATQLQHARPAPNERRCTRYVAMHPLRRATPVTSQCTRSEGVQCLQIGCTASHNKHNRENVPSRKKPRRLPLGNRRGLALTIQLSRSW